MRPYWREALWSTKRAIIGRRRVLLDGQAYRVAFESRHRKEEANYRILKRLALGKACVFDVGAYEGLTAMAMASVLNGAGRVYAFEASEEACEILAENLKLNGLDSRVVIINAIVSDRSGQIVTFYRGEHRPVGGATTVAERGLGRPSCKATLSLDDFASQTRTLPDLVKIDVEGAECQVPLGMQRLLAEVRPLVQIEIHSWERQSTQDNAGAILSALHGTRYHMTYLDSPGSRRQALLVPEEQADVRPSPS